MHDHPSQAQLDLLLHAGIFGLCRIPAGAIDDIGSLRDAGLVELDDDGCFHLTPQGERRVLAEGGTVKPRLH